MVRLEHYVDHDARPRTSHTIAKVVCADCGTEARTQIWAEEPLQVMDPLNWKQEVRGRMLVRVCPDCSAKS